MPLIDAPCMPDSIRRIGAVGMSAHRPATGRAPARNARQIAASGRVAIMRRATGACRGAARRPGVLRSGHHARHDAGESSLVGRWLILPSRSNAALPPALASCTSSLSALRFSWLVAVSWATPPELTGAEPLLAVAVDGGFAAGAALAAGFAGAGAGGGGAGGGCSFVSSVDAYWYSPPRPLIFASSASAKATSALNRPQISARLA